MVTNSNDMELKRRNFKPRFSTVYTRMQQAVCVRNACKEYGTKKDPCIVLDGLNMTVPKGIIYGLLGASGCGKTTLLNCIVGRKSLHSGEIWVMGGRPGSKASGVPGPRLGYMPQELALYGEFTIRETLTFYGWIANMNNNQIEERMDYLLKLLLIPDDSRKIVNLSIGQQRRVSLASALLHEPELLILDEPTVGVDPVLRKIIWDHFVDLTVNGNTTIIITTHYIDETRQAHLIGLMRGGSFLAEESPEQLMNRMGTETLEEAFLKLSVMQNLSRRRRSIAAQKVAEAISLPSGIVNPSTALDDLDPEAIDEISGEFGDNISLRNSSGRRESVTFLDKTGLPEIPPELKGPVQISDYLLILRKNHMKALVWKNFLWMMRNNLIMIFVIILPFLQIIIVRMVIGHEPTELTLAVVNYEANNTTNCTRPLTCDNKYLSCNYLEYLKNHSLILIPYDSEETARESVLRGKTYASVVMRHNYSASFKRRINQIQLVKSWDIKASEIDVFRDISNKPIATFIMIYMYESLRSFAQDYSTSCNLDNRVLDFPIKLETPIYGAKIPNFTEFIIPGILLAITWGLASCLTALVLLVERKEGSFDRYLISGVSGVEILFSHFITELMVLIMQVALVLCTFAIFTQTVSGSMVVMTALLILSGVCGMCYGFVVSCVCENERTVFYLIIGSSIPIMVLSGIIWPIEAMDPYLRYVAYFLPFTYASESMRSIMQRGWGLFSKTVYMGFLSLGAWTIVLLMISIIVVRFKKA